MINIYFLSKFLMWLNVRSILVEELQTIQLQAVEQEPTQAVEQEPTQAVEQEPTQAVEQEQATGQDNDIFAWSIGQVASTGKTG